ncbi:MAG: hypothetical protein ACR2H9_12310 [Longimicrobiaceae bacterium]
MRRCRLRRLMLVLLALLPLAACDRAGAPARRTVAAERFIEVNVALRQIDAEAPEADSARAAVLAEHGVTEEQMLAFVRARSDRPQELAQIWAEIQQRLEIAADTVQDEGIEEPDTLPDPPDGGEPLPPLQLPRAAGAT